MWRLNNGIGLKYHHFFAAAKFLRAYILAISLPVLTVQHREAFSTAQQHVDQVFTSHDNIPAYPLSWGDELSLIWDWSSVHSYMYTVPLEDVGLN